MSLTPPKNLSPVSLTPLNNFLGVSLTPAINFRHFGYLYRKDSLIAGVVDTAEKFINGVVDTTEQFLAVSLTPLINIHSRISPRIFEKIRNGPNGILRGPRDTYYVLYRALLIS